MNSKVYIQWLDPAIACLKMEDKEGKNSFSVDFVKTLEERIAELSQSREVKVVILAGLSSVFCSGASLDILKQIESGQIQPLDIYLSKLILDLPVPLISAMEGHATGGGLALGLCADIAILAEESRYGCSFMNMGFTPGMGITKLMEHYMSPAIAHEIQYTGAFKKGRDFKGKSNFNYILSKNQVLPQAEQIAWSIAEKNKNSIRILKRYLGLNRRRIFQETHAIESMMHEISFKDQETLKWIEENYVQ